MTDDQRWKPNVIVLGPGGAKAYLQLGALLKFEKEGYMDKVQHWIGCSAGAAIALLIVAGYSIVEIIEETLHINLLQDLMDIGSIREIIENKGLFSNKNLEQRLKQKIMQKFGLELTLQQLYMATGIVLTIVVYNMDKERPEYFSKDTEPNLSCVKAVMMSVSVPLLMQRRMYKGYEYVDGAIGNPYPIDIHDNGRNKILGIYVMTDHDSRPGANPFSFIYRVIHASLNQLRRKIITHASDNCRHLCLVAPIYDTTGLTLGDEDKKKLMRAGFDRALKFVEETEHPNKHRILLRENEEIPFEQDNLIDFQNVMEPTVSNIIKIPINQKSANIIESLENFNSSN